MDCRRETGTVDAGIQGTIRGYALKQTGTSIAVVVVAVIVFAVLLLAAAAGTIGYTLYERQERMEINALLIVVTEQAKTALALPLWNFDGRQIAQAVESIMKERSVYAVVVSQTKPESVVLARGRNAAWEPVAIEHPPLSGTFLTRTADIMHEGDIIGSIQVYTTVQFLKERLAKTRLLIIVCITIATLLLTLLLYALLWRFVLKPITVLERHTLDIKHGVATRTLASAGPFFGELDTLRISIAGMVELLETRYVDLQRKEAELRESELFRKRIFDTSRVPIVVIDYDNSRYVDCNPAAVQIYGYKNREDILGKTPVDFSAPVQYDGTHSTVKAPIYIAQAVNEGSVIFEWRHQRPDGEQWDAEVHLMSFKTGEHRFLQFTLQDITERKRVEQAFQMSEAKYHTLFDVASDAIFLMEDGRFIECNQRTLAVFGASREQILDRSPDQFSPPQQPDGSTSRVKALELISLALEGKPQSFEWLHCRHDGTPFHAEVGLTRIEYQGKVQLLAIVRDISERKRIENELRESEERYRVLVEKLPIGIVVSQGDTIVYANNAISRMIGVLNDESIIGRNIYDFIPQEYRGRAQSRRQALSASTPMADVEEFMICTMAGAQIPAEVQAVRIMFNGSPAILNLVVDVTERKKAEYNLRESEERFRQIAENIQEIFFLYEKDGDKLLYMSPVIASVFGVSIDMVHANRSIIDRAVLPEDLPHVDFIHPERFYEKPLDEEFRVRRPDGEVRWVRLRSFLVRNADGDVIRVAGLAADVTDRHVAEAQRLKMMQAEKLVSLGELSAGIAHELTQPLSALSMNAEGMLMRFAEGDIDREKVVHNLENMVSYTQRMKKLIEHVRLFSRDQKEEMQSEFDVRTSVSNALSLIGVQLANRGFAVSVRLPENAACLVTGNTFRLEQVIINMLTNARDAVEAAGRTEKRIDIAVRTEGAAVELHIRDNGSGIAPDAISKIFDPFFTTKAADKGTGLGLSISYGIIKEMRGEIRLTSDVGVGTEFIISLPSAVKAS
ncbi:MAG: PAS domain S-box protein [Spirochaetes bacterium]|nr:PAS domain S-box protein [Spirochaetota bacterium]